MTQVISVPRRIPRLLDDVTIMIGGQGGDGTLTVVNLLGRVGRSLGLNIYNSRNVLSRIRGGHADGVIRLAAKEIGSLSDHLDVLLAFDEDAVRVAAEELHQTAVVIYDSSDGEIRGDIVAGGVTVYNHPLGRLSAHHLRRELYKNTVGFGLIGRVVGFSDELMSEALNQTFARKGKQLVEANLKALQLGFKLAEEDGLLAGQSVWQLKLGKANGKLFLSGNEAVSYGFIVGGGRFFAGYPITPASEILEWLSQRLGKFNGVAKQAEDEIAAINMAIGAAYAGARAMVATSGPGVSLMTEAIGQCGAAEIPLVIVDSQRSGPSTGMPTKVEQSDLYHMVFGGHGDFPRIVLAPGNVSECFYMAVEALNLAEKYQCPVFLALDQALSQNSETVDEFQFDRLKIDRGKRLTEEDLTRMGSYKRYEITEDGISPMSIPSVAGGEALATGNEHDEWGQVATNRKNRVRMVEKRMRKLEKANSETPNAVVFGDKSASIGMISFGSCCGPILEAMNQLEKENIPSKFLQMRTIWPMHGREVSEFIDGCRRVFVVELNYQAQLANLIKIFYRDHDKISSILKFDGSPFKPSEISQAIAEKMEAVKR